MLLKTWIPLVLRVRVLWADWPGFLKTRVLRGKRPFLASIFTSEVVPLSVIVKMRLDVLSYATMLLNMSIKPIEWLVNVGRLRPTSENDIRSSVKSGSVVWMPRTLLKLIFVSKYLSFIA